MMTVWTSVSTVQVPRSAPGPCPFQVGRGRGEAGVGLSPKCAGGVAVGRERAVSVKLDLGKGNENKSVPCGLLGHVGDAETWVPSQQVSV